MIVHKMEVSIDGSAMKKCDLSYLSSSTNTLFRKYNTTYESFNQWCEFNFTTRC